MPQILTVLLKRGRPPMDPNSASENFQTVGTKRFLKDTKVQELLSNTVKLESVKAKDYDAVFYPGGHGPMWDLAEDKNSIALLESFFKDLKTIAVACHAPAVFKNTKKKDGTPLVKGLKVTGFSNSEETASGLKDVVPFLVEDMLTENGGIYSKGADWSSYVVEDGSLITGQNPASAKEVAAKLLVKLNKPTPDYKKGNIFKRMFGIAPKLESDGSYSPSKLALKFGTVKKTDFENISYAKYTGSKRKILVVFTEQKNLMMKNGKMFSTGNHPVEAILPMMHLKNAGFEFEIVTPTGKPVVFEMWAFPKEDQPVKDFYNEYKSRFESPGKLSSFVTSSFNKTASYAAVFVPGGHGATIGIPEDENVGNVLRWAHQNDLFTISLCHGPASFLATTLNNQEFLYKGYNMTVFPDEVDKKTPKVGYLPGQMSHEVSEKLKSLGANVINTESDDTVCLDRKLITGASPLASNNLGKLAAETLLKELK